MDAGVRVELTCKGYEPFGRPLAQPAIVGAASWIRTNLLWCFKPALIRLSYSGVDGGPGEIRTHTSCLLRAARLPIAPLARDGFLDASRTHTRQLRRPPASSAGEEMERPE